MTTSESRALTGRVAGKVCLVTGAGDGIGRAIAERLGEEGGRVLCVDIKGDTADNTAKQIVAGGGEAFAQRVDVAERSEVDAAVQAAVDRWGGLDILVNNAGVNLPGALYPVSEEEAAQGLRSITGEIIDRTLDVNLKGPMWGCLAAIPVMRSSRPRVYRQYFERKRSRKRALPLGLHGLQARRRRVHKGCRPRPGKDRYSVQCHLPRLGRHSD